MKLNVKGLVFVGFAAAVFANAANAAGEEKTVTSLKYTEATYEKSGNKVPAFNDDNKNSTTLYPSNAAVTAALAANGGTVEDSTITVKLNGAMVDSFTVNAATDKDVDITGVQTTSNLSASIATDTGSTTKYPSVAAVEAYVDTAVAAEANVQADWNQTTTTADDYIKNKPTALSQFTDDLGDQKTANLSASIATDTGSTTKYPSVAAVEAYVGTQATANQANWTETTTTSPSYIQNKPNLHAVATSGSYTDLSNKPTIGSATITISDGTTTQTFGVNDTEGTTINIPSVAGTIPVATGCSTSTPCALVATGTNTFGWEPIQQ